MGRDRTDIGALLKSEEGKKKKKSRAGNARIGKKQKSMRKNLATPFQKASASPLDRRGKEGKFR